MTFKISYIVSDSVPEFSINFLLSKNYLMTFSRYNKFDKRCASNIHEIRRKFITVPIFPASLQLMICDKQKRHD